MYVLGKLRSANTIPNGYVEGIVIRDGMLKRGSHKVCVCGVSPSSPKSGASLVCGCTWI